MPSSSRQAKRPYAGSQVQAQQQSAITAYFQAAPSPSSPFPVRRLNAIPHGSVVSSASAQEQCSPVELELPPLVQSNLLSVGMRVRKAVPEGYKTGKGHDDHGNGIRTGVIVPLGAAVSGGAAGHTFLPAGHVVPAGSRRARGEGRERFGGMVGRELMPLCGILKVGGFQVQGEGMENLAQEGEKEGGARRDDGGFSQWDGEELPFLSSQGSTISTVSGTSMSTGGLKRAYHEDDEEGYEIREAAASEWRQDGGIWQDEELELSPKTKPMRLIGIDKCLGRVVAVPKSRRRAGSGGTRRFEVLEGQENEKMVDFDEAEFLDYGIWNREVVMGDV